MFILVLISFLLIFLNTPSQVSAIVPIQVTACDANINGEGQVDLTDYSLLVQDFMKGLPPYQPPASSRTDINKSGLVDIFDYSLFVQFFGQTCVITPMPTHTPTLTPTPAVGQTGPQGVVGPEGAAQRTCEGLTSCVSCTPTTCSNGKSWDATITTAKPGDMILMKTGTYTRSSDLVIPQGTASAPITIARYGNEKPVINNVKVRFCDSNCTNGGGFVNLEGISVYTDVSEDYSILFDNQTSTKPIQSVRGSYLDVRGGKTEAVRMRGAIRDVTINNSLLDGGNLNHVMKILCNQTSSCDPAKVPENISIVSNIFSKNTSSFFPKIDTDTVTGVQTTVCGDETNQVGLVKGSGDLLQLERAGSVIIKNNKFGFNNYEDCLDIKPEGRAGADLEISYNIIDSTDNGTSACTPAPIGCRTEGLIIHGTKPAHTGNVQIKNNQFVGGGNLFRTAGPTVSVSNNQFKDTRVSIEDPLFIFSANSYLGSALCSLKNGATCDK